MAETQTALTSGFRLSPQQRRICTLQNAGECMPYRVQCAVSIKGKLDVSALRSAIDSVVGRYEILRTTYSQLPGLTIPVQKVEETGKWSFTAFDFSHWPTDRHGIEVELLSGQLSRSGFDLEHGFPLHVRLITLSESETILLLLLPALCADKSTMKSLVAVIIREYEAALNDEVVTHEPMQYADIAEWYNELHVSKHSSSAKGFWSDQHLDESLNLRAPFEGDGPGTSRFEPAVEAALLEGEIIERIEAVAKSFNASADQVLLACWMVLLWRLTGQPGIVVGAAFDNRKYAEIKDALGLLETYLPMHARLTDEIKLSELLGQIGECANDNYKWQEYFGWEGREDSKADIEPPFFPICFDYDSIAENYSKGGLTFSIQSIYSCVDRFKLRLFCVRRPDSLAAELHYDSALFDQEDILRLADHFQLLLKSISENPTSRISELEIISDKERSVLLFDLNDTRRDYPLHKCAHELFEEQVEKTPDEVAVLCGDDTLTYRQLDQRADHLADYLAELGVGPEVVVGVCLDRGLELAVGLLGVLKAGGAYLPVDPSLPVDRLAFVLDDASAFALLTQKAYLNRFQSNGRKVISIDEGWEEVSAQSRRQRAEGVGPDNLAYVIYTSGSTGSPKGVMVTHRGLVNYLCWAADAYDVARTSGSVVHSSIGFDLTVTSLYLPLISGKAVEMLSGDDSVEELSRGVTSSREGVLVKATPTQVEMMARRVKASGEQAKASVYVIGGEALTSEVVERLREVNVGARVINEYGPTEAVVGCSVKEVGEGEVRGEVSIGRPIGNARMYVMDQWQGVSPVGVEGEIYIGGAGLARGYLGRGDKTAEVFVPDSVSGEAGGRLYRSGDVGRYTGSGEIEYAGRRDEQVKVRGYRVELGEVECAIKGVVEGVREVAVVAQGEGIDRRLVAYIVRGAGEEIKVGEVRRKLEERMPAYMVPARYVMLERMPLTRNGKVDRKSLSQQVDEQTGSEENYVAPRTLTEEILAEIWADILGVERVGIDDSFFALGGDSIQSIKLRYKAQQRGLDIPHQKLFQFQTIRNLAQQIRFEDAATVKIRRTVPFDLISEDDRLRLPDHIVDAYPLTLLQAGMVFHSELSPEAPIFHDVHSCHLRAPFDEQSLRLALSRLFERHDVLRASFALSGFSESLQLVHAEVDTPLKVDDLRHLSPETQQEVIAVWMEQDKGRHFDWSRSPLLRFHVHRRSEESFQFTLSFHHAILDGWSVATMLTELFQDYLSLLENNAREINGPAISFRDYVALEQEVLRSEEAKEYWAATLDDSSITKLPRIDRSEPAADQKEQIALEQVIISAETSDGLKRLARSLSVPLKSVLLTAHLKVLSVLAGNSDVTTGYLSHGRPEDIDGDRVLGLFINNLPFRINVPDGTWADLVQNVFEVERSMQPYRLYPLARIQQEQSNRELFETAFSFLHFHVYQSLDGLQSMKDVKIASWDSFEQTNFALLAYFSLDLVVSQVRLDISYDSSRLTSRQVQAIGQYYRRALESLAAEPSKIHTSVSLLSDEELHQVLIDWNASRVDYPLDKCAHQLFEEQVEKTPDEVAILCGDDTLTYRQLDQRADLLADYLTGLGVGPEVVVGVCLDRGLELAVGLLGVLKAGGAYLPVDPSLPVDRLAFVLDDASAFALLTQKAYLNRFPANGRKVISLDEGWEEASAQSRRHRAGGVGPDNLAYVIYTSGSTGSPKGVMVTHLGLVNYLCWAAQAYDVARTSGSVVHSSVGFDLTVTSLYLPLITGKPVEMLSGDDSVEELSKGVTSSREGVLVKATPTQVEMMARRVKASGEQAKASVYVIGGEALTSEVVERLREVNAGARVINEYGPTEAVVGCSVKEVEEREVGGEVSIGRPIGNARMYVMDQWQEVAPIGVEGEIYIGGAGVARGYLGRGDKTAEVFVPDSVSGEAGGRLYRTGDVGRYTGSGEIEYAGRRDEQVKVRGYRVELGEVECAIKGSVEGVREVAVVAQGEGIDRRLVAYVTPERDVELTVTLLRQRVSEKLPVYMVPSEFIVLERMPLTRNGKIDRKALPAPETVRINSTETLSSARTPIEDLLAGIWATILELDYIGVNDNFFNLGGHSIRAIQLIVRVRETLNVALSLRSLFDSPTLAGFSRVVEAALSSAEHQARPPITRVSRDERIPLSFAQQRLWFIHQLEPDSPAYNVPIGVRLHGPLIVRALEQTFNEIVRRHEVLRTTFAEEDGEPVQIISPAQFMAVPVIDLSLLEGSQREAEIERLAVEDAQLPFDLARGPVLRVHLIQAAKDDAVVLCTMHHIVSDGWSIGVFVREIATLYEAFAGGLDSPLPELDVQYADYAHWQRLWLQGEVLASQLDYWKGHLAGVPEVINLPTDWPRTASATYRGANEPWNLPEGLAGQITALNRQEGVTLFMTLLTSLQVLLHWYSGDDDVVVGTDVANRTRSQTEDLIGFFINQLVLRSDLSGDPTFRGLLSRVRHITLDAYTHQDIPFEKLVESLNPERSLSYTPLFQVKLVVHNVPTSDLQLSGLTITPIQTPIGKAKYDLVFNAMESEGSLGGWLEYNTGIFKSATAARFLNDFELLLRSVIASPDLRISDLKEELARANKEREINQQKELEELRLQKLRSIKRRASRPKEAALVN